MNMDRQYDISTNRDRGRQIETDRHWTQTESKRDRQKQSDRET